MVEFSTMISTIDKAKNKSIFARIKTVDKNYPLFGKVGYEPSGAFEKLQTTENTILVNENIFKNLNLEINDIIKVQDQTLYCNWYRKIGTRYWGCICIW